MISESFFGVDTVEPKVSVVGDREGAGAAARGYCVTWTPCTFGGRRPWLVCPHCGRRCLNLYGAAGETWCRLCLLMGYWSRLRADWVERRRRKAERIRVRLGGSPAASKRLPRRPRGMHWRTYDRLRNEVRVLEWIADDAEATRELRSWGRGPGGWLFGGRESVRYYSERLKRLRNAKTVDDIWALCEPRGKRRLRDR